MCGLYLNDPAFIKMYAGEQDGFKQQFINVFSKVRL